MINLTTCFPFVSPRSLEMWNTLVGPKAHRSSFDDD